MTRTQRTGANALRIAMVHLEEGWFVVGAGRNEMEYSVLLIVALVAITMRHRPDTSQEQKTTPLSSS